MRPAVLAAGLGLLVLIWGGPLLSGDRASFAAHMLAHMGVIALAAPLLALGIAGTRWDFSGHAALAPVPLTLLELAAVWGWHAPALRQLAAGSAAVTVAEQASFLAAGLLLWVCCIGRAGSPGAGAFALLLTSMHMTLLGALLALAPRPLFGEGAVTCLGLRLDPGQDQQLGGVLMLTIGGAVYLAGGLTLVARLLAGARPASPP
jgi:putative membrane protein